MLRSGFSVHAHYRSLTVLLALAAVAQTPAPVSLVVSPATVQATNVSSKEIALFTVLVSTQASGYPNPDYPAAHDFYFKPGGFSVGDIHEVARSGSDKETITAAKLLYVQFADGTSWGNGDDRATKGVLQKRPALRTFYSEAISDYQNGGEQAFIDCLKKTQWPAEGKALYFIRVQQQSGTSEAVAQIQLRLTTANSRSF